MKKSNPEAKPKKRKPNWEAQLQKSVVKWLEVVLPPDAALWAVLNERKESAVLGAYRNAMGRQAGVSDLMVLYNCNLHCIELKTERDDLRGIKRGYQSPAQKTWQADAVRAGGAYAVCRSIGDVEAFLLAHRVPLRLSAA